jgi:hypothetical protein
MKKLMKKLRLIHIPVFIASLVLINISKNSAVDLDSSLVRQITYDKDTIAPWKVSGTSDSAPVSLDIESMCEKLVLISSENPPSAGIRLNFRIELERDLEDYEIFTTSPNSRSNTRMSLVLNEERDVVLYFGDYNGPLYLQGLEVAAPNFDVFSNSLNYVQTDVIDFEINLVRLRGDFQNEIGVLTLLRTPSRPDEEAKTFFRINVERLKETDCGSIGVLGLGKSNSKIMLEITSSNYVGKENSVQRLFAIKFVGLFLAMLWLYLTFRKKVIQ